MVVGTAATAAITCLFATADLSTPLSTIAGFAFIRGLAVGMVFVSIQTAAYTDDVDGRHRPGDQPVQHAAPGRLRIGCCTRCHGDRRDADAPWSRLLDAELLSAYQAGFLAVGLIMAPAAIISWFIHDDDVAATRGLIPATPPHSNQLAPRPRP